MYSILIVDDDPVSQMMLKRILGQQGYRVEMAQNGQEGIQKAQEIQPALIICDWMMPIMDGLDVCRFIKTHPQLCTSFFILLTSRTDLDDRIEGLNAGADEFLAKPIDMNELKARVRAGLRLHQLNQDLQIQKQALENELAEAVGYVRSLLPAPMEAPLRIESLFLPSRQLGGDCFDYFWLTVETLAIYLLDVSGHGLGAALPSVSILNLLRSRSLQGVNYAHPAEVLTALNQSFQMSNHDNKYFTIWYGVYHLPSQTLTYSSAGHPPALLWTDQGRHCQHLKTSGFPIGLFSEGGYASSHCQVPFGSLMYILSDGVYEIYQPEGVIWGIDAFEKLLHDNAACYEKTLPEILESIQSSAKATAFMDDLSLLKIHFPLDRSIA
jgi:phosphoserine phosphatase RsbU/P